MIWWEKKTMNIIICFIKLYGFYLEYLLIEIEKNLYFTKMKILSIIWFFL
jgi:hypothetical protein